MRDSNDPINNRANISIMPEKINNICKINNLNLFFSENNFIRSAI